MIIWVQGFVKSTCSGSITKCIISALLVAQHEGSVVISPGHSAITACTLYVIRLHDVKTSSKLATNQLETSSKLAQNLLQMVRKDIGGNEL